MQMHPNVATQTDADEVSSSEALREFHEYAKEYARADTDTERLKIALLELREKNMAYAKLCKMCTKLQLSPIFGTVGLLGLLLTLVAEKVTSWMVP